MAFYETKRFWGLVLAIIGLIMAGGYFDVVEKLMGDAADQIQEEIQENAVQATENSTANEKESKENG